MPSGSRDKLKALPRPAAALSSSASIGNDAPKARFGNIGARVAADRDQGRLSRLSPGAHRWCRIIEHDPTSLRHRIGKYGVVRTGRTSSPDRAAPSFRCPSASKSQPGAKRSFPGRRRRSRSSPPAAVSLSTNRQARSARPCPTLWRLSSSMSMTTGAFGIGTGRHLLEEIELQEAQFLHHGRILIAQTDERQ